MQVGCWGRLPRRPLQELVQSMLQRGPSGVRRSHPSRGEASAGWYSWSLWPAPKLTHMEKALGWYRCGEGKVGG